MEKYLHLLSRGDKIGLALIRLSIAIVFMWIGLLKFVPYEADSITPFVANSPLMSFFYEHPEDYKQYLTHEGEYKPEARAWQSANNTYGFSNGLGVVEGRTCRHYWGKGDSEWKKNLNRDICPRHAAGQN